MFTPGTCGSDQPTSPELPHVHSVKSSDSTRSEGFPVDAESGDPEPTEHIDHGFAVEKYRGKGKRILVKIV